MASRQQVLLIDDIDGSEANETVLFGLDGDSLEIDLTTARAADLRNVLRNYVPYARKITGQPRYPARGAAAPTAQKGGREDRTEERAWLVANGYKLKDRGRIPAELDVLWRNRDKSQAISPRRLAPEPPPAPEPPVMPRFSGMPPINETGPVIGAQESPKADDDEPPVKTTTTRKRRAVPAVEPETPAPPARRRRTTAEKKLTPVDTDEIQDARDDDEAVYGPR